MTGVPSIVVGIFVYTLLVLSMRRFSALAGGVALAILMLPTVTRTTEELLKLVPDSLREAALALGVPRWRTTLHVVLRTAPPGIATGIMLAVARVAGETAPLLFTAFNNRFWCARLDEPIASLPVQIFTYAVSPYEDWHRRPGGSAAARAGCSISRTAKLWRGERMRTADEDGRRIFGPCSRAESRSPASEDIPAAVRRDEHRGPPRLVRGSRGPQGRHAAHPGPR